MNGVEDYISTLKPNIQEVVVAIRNDIKKHDNVKEIMLTNILMYRFPAWWIYINTHKRNFVVLGWGRWKHMIKQNPMLKLLFDEVKTVVAKIKIPDIEVYRQKHISELIDFSIQNL